MHFLRSTILFGFLLTLLACASGGTDDGSPSDGAGAKDDDSEDSDPPKTSSSGGKKDAGATSASSNSKPKDAGSSQSPNPSKPVVSVSVDAGATGFTIPDLFPAAPDAGTSTSTGPRDVNGPCKDLQLLCFDIFDMFIINPSDCMTCNSGKGCQGCAIPFAF